MHNDRCFHPLSGTLSSITTARMSHWFAQCNILRIAEQQSRVLSYFRTFGRLKCHTFINFKSFFADRRKKSCSLVFFVESLESHNHNQFAATLSRFNGFGISIPLGKEDCCIICALPTDAVLAVLVAVVPSSPDILQLRGNY